jgi:hypothetical protein
MDVWGVIAICALLAFDSWLTNRAWSKIWKRLDAIDERDRAQTELMRANYDFIMADRGAWRSLAQSSAEYESVINKTIGSMNTSIGHISAVLRAATKGE